MPVFAAPAAAFDRCATIRRKLWLTKTRPYRAEIVIDFNVDSEVRAAGAHHGATFFEHRAFVEAIRTGGKPGVSVEDGALAVAVGIAAERSAQLHRPLELREVGF